MYVHEFAIGFGPKLFSWGKNETSYSLRLLPIGGYVLVAQHAAKHFFPDLYGYTEENDELIKTHDMKIPIKRLYENVSFPKKILFILAGIILNLLFGMLCFYISITIMNHNGSGKIYPYWLNLGNNLNAIFTALGHIFIFNFSHMGSVIQIGKETKGIWNDGSYFFLLIGSVSLSLAVFNLLPIAPMDGYKFVGLFYHWVTGKPMSEKLNNILNIIGLSLIMLLFVGLLLKDLIS